MLQEVPRVCLKDYLDGDEAARKNFIDTLGEGLKEIGFVIVSNHGINMDLTAKTYDAYKRFFALDSKTKDKYNCVPGGQRAYTPFGREQAKDADTPDLKEFWHVGQDLPADHDYSGDYPANVWPDEIPELKELSLQMYRSFENCARTLLKALAHYFELPETTFSSMMKDGDSVYRIIHYPPVREGDPVNAVRAAAHEDINLITLLTQSEGQGLELLRRDGSWLPVNALEGDIVVDSGDMLQRVTNGVIPATTHRVVNPDLTDNSARYSMPFFVHPYAACDLTVMDHFTSEEQPAKWEPITARNFLQQRLREIGLID